MERKHRGRKFLPSGPFHVGRQESTMHQCAPILSGACAAVALPLSGAAPAAGAGTKDCVKIDTGFKQDGQRVFFAVELRNGCGHALRCKIYTSLVSSREHLLKEKTLALAAAGPKATGGVSLPREDRQRQREHVARMPRRLMRAATSDYPHAGVLI
jgi:hypothetical protein